jgi:hypothetical protein
LGGFVEVAGGKGPKPERLLDRAKRKFVIAKILGKSDGKMHPGRAAEDVKERAKLALERVDEDLAAFGVEQPHAPNVAGKMTFAEKVGENSLVEMRRTDVHGVAHGEEGIDEIGRNDDVSDAKGREKDLAESTDVDDAGRVVEAL